MDFTQLLSKLTELGQSQVDERSVLDSPTDSHRFDDQVSGTEKTKPIRVLGVKSDTKHPFQGRLVGADESVDQSLSEDLIAQLTQEFADFLRDKQPVMDNVFPAAQDRDLGNKPADRELASEAKTKKLSDTPADRLRQGRCVDCGQDLRTVGRGEDGRCRECEQDLTEGWKPKNKAKHQACQQSVKNRVSVWPSAYASAQVVQCYYGKQKRKRKS